MTHFTRLPTPVEAQRFDGSDASARAIAAAFPYRVARAVDRPDELLVLCGAVGRLVRVLEGTWVVESSATRVLELYPDEEFARTHSPRSG